MTHLCIDQNAPYHSLATVQSLERAGKLEVQNLDSKYFQYYLNPIQSPN